MGGAEGNGGWCWLWWLLGNKGFEGGGFGSRRGRATFSAIRERERGREKEREREIGFNQAGRSGLNWDVYELQPQGKIFWLRDKDRAQDFWEGVGVWDYGCISYCLGHSIPCCKNKNKNKNR
jgi:hypothetical protein